MNDERFVVLRCKPADTLLVAQGLNALGVWAWSPAVKLRMRLPRSKVVGDVIKPILPSFLFAERDSLEIEQGSSGPKFRPMVVNGAVVLVSQQDLEPLAEAERRAAIAKKPKIEYRVGQSLTIPFGPFAGMLGVIVKIDSHYIRLEIQNTSWQTKNIAFAIKSLQP